MGATRLGGFCPAVCSSYRSPGIDSCQKQNLPRSTHVMVHVAPGSLLQWDGGTVGEQGSNRWLSTGRS